MQIMRHLAIAAPRSLITGNITSNITDYSIITDNADCEQKLLPLLSKNFEGARGRLCSWKGAPVPWHNGTMASPSLCCLFVK